MVKPHLVTAEDVERYRQNYLVEMDGIALYRRMAEAESDKDRAAIFEKMAQTEERHAQRWVRLIESGGGAVPKYRPSLRVRALGWVARKYGTGRVLPIISSMESRDEAGYMQQPEAAGLPAEERAHSRTLWAMGRRRAWRRFDCRHRTLARRRPRRRFARCGLRYQ